MKHKKDFKKDNLYFDKKYCCDFRNAINSSPIFENDPKYLSQYNLCCAVMDRLDTCIAKLNKYGDIPDSEEDFLVFMMFACMVYDAVKQLLSVLNIPEQNSEREYFKLIYEKSRIFNPEAEAPTDDKFFEYIRSLIFAHPFGTGRPKFLHKDEVQYSPWVIVNGISSVFSGVKNAVGARIYSNQSEEIIDLEFPFDILKQFICFKYEQLELATKWVEEQVANAENNWRMFKVNQDQSPVEILIEIDKILTSRYETCYSIRDFIKYMSCSLSDLRNISAVETFRAEIVGRIPELCMSVDNLDYESVEKICSTITRRPSQMHKMAHYQLEKIFDYLGDKTSLTENNDAESWGLTQADDFSKEFARKWVYIDVKTMPYLEIKLLVRVACYLESMAQEHACLECRK